MEQRFIFYDLRKIVPQCGYLNKGSLRKTEKNTFNLQISTKSLAHFKFTNPQGSRH